MSRSFGDRSPLRSSLFAIGTTGALVVGLAVVPAGATAVADASAEMPRFIQEGTRADSGGQAVPWGTGLGLRADGDTTYAWELSPGVTHTAISTGETGSASITIFLRSDGRAVALVDDDQQSQPVVPELPDGFEYTAVSAGENGASFLLRSDGALVTMVRRNVPTPQVPVLPAGMSYSAVDAGLAGAYAVRSDGQIIGFKAGWSSSLPLTCTDAFVPPVGLKYTAINAAHLSWAAVRSDGAVVYCRYGTSSAQVVTPAAGTRFVGVDIERGPDGNARAFGYALQDDGVIVGFGSAPKPAPVPVGRTVVGLVADVTYPSAEHGSGGTAVLDDGTLLTWGGAEAAPAPYVPGPPGAVAVSSYGSEKWLIRAGHAPAVELEVTSPTTVDYNQLTDVEVAVTTVDGISPSGWVRLGEVRDDGTTRWGVPEQVVDGRVAFTFRASPEGTYRRALRFDGPPFTTTVLPVDFVVRPQMPSTLTVDMPESWRVGESGVYVQTHVTAEGGASTDAGSLRVIAEATGEALSTSSYRGRLHIDTSVLPVGGNQRVRVDYLSEGPAASTSWVGRVTVLPTPETVTTAESELVVDYADYSAQLEVDVSVRTRDGSRLGVGNFEIRTADGTELGSSGQLWDDESGVLTDSVDVHTDEMPPGEYPVTVAWIPRRDWDLAYPTSETLPSEWTGTLTIRKAPTSTRVAISNGFQYGRDTSVSAGVVPSTITDVEGELVAKIDGVEVGRADVVRDTSDTSGEGVSVPVALSGVSAGTHQLEISYLGSNRLQPSALSQQIEVARAAFSARAVTVVGTAQVGATLTANRGTWMPVPSSTTYVWMADGVPIAGATTSSLTVPGSALGKRISVAVTGDRANYTTKTLVSLVTVAVKAGAFVAPKPAITGTTRVGYTLKAVRGTWTPQPSTVKYQWKVDGAAVRGATDSTFKVPASAKGKRVAVVVTGSRTGYVTKTVTSPSTSTVR